MGAGARPELALPDGEIVELAPLEMVADAPDPDLDPGEVDHVEALGQRRIRACVVVSDHDHEAVVDHERTHAVDLGADHVRELAGVSRLHQRPPVRIA